MVLNAIVTNASSNALHAAFLLFYLIGALVHYCKQDTNLSLEWVLFFLTLVILKLLGVYVHYYNTNMMLPPAWIAITLVTVMLNYLLVQALEMPQSFRISIVFLSLASSYLFLTHQGKFVYIALPVMLVYIIAAFFSRSMLRVGFIMVVLSNILWIVSRQIENYILGHDIPIEYRYDNDAYHLLLIISTFIIYKAIVNGDWKPASLISYRKNRAPNA